MGCLEQTLNHFFLHLKKEEKTMSYQIQLLFNYFGYFSLWIVFGKKYYFFDQIRDLIGASKDIAHWGLSVPSKHHSALRHYIGPKRAMKLYLCPLILHATLKYSIKWMFNYTRVYKRHLNGFIVLLFITVLNMVMVLLTIKCNI